MPDYPRLGSRRARLAFAIATRVLQLATRGMNESGTKSARAEWLGEIWYRLDGLDSNSASTLSYLRTAFRSFGAFGFARYRKSLSPRKHNMLDHLLQDLRYAFRRMRQAPSFVLLAVAIIGVGIGANTAIFSIVNSVLFRPLPFDDQDRLLRLFMTAENEDRPGAVSYPDYQDMASYSDVLSGAALTTAAIVSLITDDGAEAMFIEAQTANFFSVTGLVPELGRTFAPAEDEAGAEPVAIISYDAWKRRFGGESGVIGSEVRINGRPVTIVGVGPEGFNGTFVGLKTELWVPKSAFIMIDPTQAPGFEQRNARGNFMIARMQPGVTIDQVRSVMNSAAESLAELYPTTNEGRGIVVMASNDVRLHPFLDRALYPVAALLMVVVGLVLLVACTNLANLLLVKGVTRKKEIALRLAVGASRGRVVSQLLTESVLLSIGGGIFGLLVARYMAQLIVTFEPPIPIPIALDISMDSTVLAFTMVASVLTGIVFGALPAMRSSRPDLVSSLKDDQPVVSRERRLNLRNVLVVSQVALSVLLLSAAGLFVRALGHAQAVDPGIEIDQVAVGSVDLGLASRDVGAKEIFMNNIREELLQHPNITTVGFVDRIPLTASLQTRRVMVDGYTPPGDNEWFDSDFGRADADYFNAFGIDILRGRNFDDGDRADAQLVAIVNEAFAQQYFGRSDVVGELVKIRKNGWTDITVVGVAATTKVRTLGEFPRPMLFTPLAQEDDGFVSAIIRTAGNPQFAVDEFRLAVRDIDPFMPVFQAGTMQQSMGFAFFAPRMGAIMLSAFGLVALILASLGLYAVIGFTVARRTREVGIRMALGARSTQVVASVMAGTFWLVLIGSVIGIGLGVLAAMPLSSMMAGIPAFDPIGMIGVVGLLLLVAAIASSGPALKAVRVDPTEALRTD